MKVLAIGRDAPGAVNEQFTSDMLRAESSKVWELTRAGILREIYFTEDRDAVLILECAGVDEARRHLSELPLAAAGLIAFEIMGLVPYDGFERLFAV